MRFWKYIIRNSRRNKLRTALTILSTAFSLMLVTLLYGYLAIQEDIKRMSRQYNRLVVMPEQGLVGALPLAYLDRIRNVPGVKVAVPLSWYGGKYGDERLPLPQFGTDAQKLFEVWDEYKIAPEALKAWQADPTGCIAEKQLVRDKGWKIGERIPLKGTIYPYDLDLTLHGIVECPQGSEGLLWFHLDYLEEGLKRMGARMAGNAGIIFIKAESADIIPDLAGRIDARFANSSTPTRSETEEAFIQMFIEMAGNVQAFIRNISLAVVFSLVLVAANAMAMSVRERTSEVAVLKAIGFSRPLVLALILGESMLISAAGGVLGVAGGQGICWLAHTLFPLYWGISALPWRTLGYGVIVAGFIGLASGMVPSWRAAQLSVIDGLRKVV